MLKSLAAGAVLVALSGCTTIEHLEDYGVKMFQGYCERTPAARSVVRARVTAKIQTAVPDAPAEPIKVNCPGDIAQ